MKNTVLLLLISVFSLTTSFACSCIDIEQSLSKKVEQAYSQSDLIISGKVINIEIVNKGTITSSADPLIYKFEVIKFIKGELKTEIIEIASERSGASCGYTFQLGKSYLVYARKSNHFSAKTHNEFDFVTGLCTRNQSLKDVKRKEFRKLKRLNCRNKK